MDPKGLNNLDPKLREAYDRVMNTAVSSGPQTNSQTPPTAYPGVSAAPFGQGLSATPNPPSPAQQIPGEMPMQQGFGQQDTDTNTFAAATADALTPAYTPADSAALQNAESNMQRQNLAAENATAVLQQQLPQANAGNRSSLIRILYVVSAIIFLGLYTFVWIKIFNLQLPF
jgi:hypothetical protein